MPRFFGGGEIVGPWGGEERHEKPHMHVITIILKDNFPIIIHEKIN
jgi:hypothetical protein